MALPFFRGKTVSFALWLSGCVFPTALPKFSPSGCGNAGFKWEKARPLIEKAFEALPEVRAPVYAPEGPPAGKVEDPATVGHSILD